MFLYPGPQLTLIHAQILVSQPKPEGQFLAGQLSEGTGISQTQTRENVASSRIVQGYLPSISHSPPGPCILHNYNPDNKPYPVLRMTNMGPSFTPPISHQ
jgi:hypothetical protein